MKTDRFASASLVLAGLLTSGVLAWGNESTGSGVRIPDRVKKTFAATFPGAKITALDVEKENGIAVYDFEFTDGVIEKETDIAADGTMLEFTVVVDASAVPVDAMNTIREAATGATIERIERVEISYETRNGKVVKLLRPMTEYAVEMAKGDRRAEVVVGLDGGVIEPARWDAAGGDGVTLLIPAEVRERAAQLFGSATHVQYERMTAIFFGVKVGAGQRGEKEYLLNQAGVAFEEAANGIHETNDKKSEAPERQVAREAIPETVWNTANRFSDGGTLHACVIGDEDGLEVYELVFKKAGREIEVNVTAAGELCGAEEEVPASQVPDEVRRSAVKLLTPGAKIAYETRTQTVFALTVSDDQGQEVEYLVNLAGAAFKHVIGGRTEKEKRPAP
jgi:uncharacterized membrane protein YkoI